MSSWVAKGVLEVSVRERRRMYQRARISGFEGGGEEVRRVAAAMAAARGCREARRAAGEEAVGGVAVRKGGRSVVFGRGWKLVGWRRKERSLVERDGGGEGNDAVGVAGLRGVGENGGLDCW